MLKSILMLGKVIYYRIFEVSKQNKNKHLNLIIIMKTLNNLRNLDAQLKALIIAGLVLTTLFASMFLSHGFSAF